MGLSAMRVARNLGEEFEEVLLVSGMGAGESIQAERT
jgi:hypothetical protein